MRLAGRCSWCAVALVLATSWGCGSKTGLVARVGDRSIEVSSLQAYLEAATGARWQAVNERVASRLFDQFLDQEVLVAAAGRDPAATTLDPARRALVVRRLLDELCGPVPDPSPEAIRAEVASRGTKPRPARAHVRQMLLDTAEEAAAARRRVQAGEPFERVSREVSRAPNADTGGELGFIQRGTLPPDLDAVIFSLEPGAISAPVQSPAGYHVFQVLEVVPEGPPDSAEIEPVVRRELEDQIAREHTGACVERLAGEVGVEVFTDNLWFEYEGRYEQARSRA